MRLFGSTDKPAPKRKPASERFWSKVDAEGDCWVWTGSQAGGGYGWFMAEKGKSIPAHRWAYEHLVGPISAGLDIDHLCRNRPCVNPDHLEPVTRAENMRRAPVDAGKIQAAKTHCPYGHPYSAENVKLDRSRRRCRECLNAARRRRRAQRKAAA